MEKETEEKKIPLGVAHTFYMNNKGYLVFQGHLVKQKYKFDKLPLKIFFVLFLKNLIQ